MILRQHPLVGFAALAALVGSPAAHAQSSPPDAPPTTVAPAEVVATIKSTDWIYKPSSAQMNGFLPSSVTRHNGHRTGEVVLKCRIHPDDTVTDCSVVDQTNPEYPFGEAAVRASKIFRIKPPALNDAAIDNTWVLVPLSFDVLVKGF